MLGCDASRVSTLLTGNVRRAHERSFYMQAFHTFNHGSRVVMFSKPMSIMHFTSVRSTDRVQAYIVYIYYTYTGTV